MINNFDPKDGQQQEETQEQANENAGTETQPEATEGTEENAE